MNISNILQSFRDKKFRYGGYAALMTAIVLAMVALFNLLVDQIPATLDMTQNRRFSLAEQTYHLIDNLEQDVMIYHIAQTGRENVVVDQIIDRYVKRSRRISSEYIDPVRNPGRMKQFEEEEESIAEGSLILQSGERFKIISQYDLINYGYDQQYQPQARSLAVEQRLTSALAYVTGGASSTLFQLGGHQEGTIPYDVYKQLELENFTTKDLDLIAAEEGIPVEDSILVIYAPRLDIAESEEKRIFEYLSSGGRALIIVDIAVEVRPNLQRLLESYGIRLQNTFVVETDSSMNAAGYPNFLLPMLKSHEILYPLTIADLQVMIPNAQAIEILGVKKRTIEVEPLLVTSEGAYAKVDLEADPSIKQAEDLSGPFNVAVAVTDKPTEDRARATKLVVVGSSLFMNAQFLGMIPGNGNFFMNCLNWLQERKDTISIRPKSLMVPGLRLTGRWSLILSGIVVIIMPLSILGAGLAVWLRRRHL